ncbi:class I SAM-dependent methyltransferase [Patulibacter brassicae]|uniref:Class I SAM-dependent methyltransferase n=1 Tax=Patulibacter brassicae TaxID=1705717 RepID=A0ABU4VE59_9ACTN|nr:class I SAM-dependent methyltransferase [Patulibacter brassicae]MDX8150037.1 class I SAM-dependent methyltransferase [Patulibacter brassicae]
MAAEPGRLRRAASGALRRALARHDRRLVDLRHHRVVERSYAGPVPEWERLPPETFTAPHPMPGVAWDPLPGLALLEGELRDGLAELELPALAEIPPAERAELLRFYEGLDAAALHALVRHVRPRRVVELGSGVSTLVTARALERNAADGAPGELVAYDPYPRAPTAAAVHDIRRVPAEEVPRAAVEELDAGDVLFVDTTHVVRTGGDVVRIYLDLVPRLAPGVLLHVHDVLLPYDYHREWLANGWFWNEQYLVQALLQGNPEWEVVLAHHQLHREHGDRVAAAVPAYDGAGQHPSALWLRRRVPGEEGPLAARLRAHRPDGPEPTR